MPAAFIFHISCLQVEVSLSPIPPHSLVFVHCLTLAYVVFTRSYLFLNSCTVAFFWRVLVAFFVLHLHRDIKPENILLGSAAADWPWTAHVGDFGFAAMLSTGRPHAGDTGGLLREVLGTPQFLAPDFFRCHSQSGERTGYGTAVDLWSVGVVLVWMLTGELPFQGAFLVDIVKAVRTGAVLPAGLNSVCPAARSLVRGLLQVDPERRLTALAALHHPFLVEVEWAADTTSSPSTDRLGTANFLTTELPELDADPTLPFVAGVSSGGRRCSSSLCLHRTHDILVGSANFQAPSRVSQSSTHVACACSRRLVVGEGGHADFSTRGPASDNVPLADFASTSSRSLRVPSTSGGNGADGFIGGSKPPLLPSLLRRPLAGGASTPSLLTPEATATAAAEAAATPFLREPNMRAPLCDAFPPLTPTSELPTHRSYSENEVLNNRAGRRWTSSVVDAFEQPASLSPQASPSLASLPWGGTASLPGRRGSTLSSSSRSGGRSAPPPGVCAALRWRRLAIVVLAGRRFITAGLVFSSKAVTPPAPPQSSMASAFSSGVSTSISGTPSSTCSSTYFAPRSHRLLRRSSAQGPSIAARVSSFDSGRLWSRSSAPALARLTASLSTELGGGGHVQQAAGVATAGGSSGSRGDAEPRRLRLPGRQVACQRSHSMHRQPTSPLAGVCCGDVETNIPASSLTMATDREASAAGLGEGACGPFSVSQSFPATSASYRAPVRPTLPNHLDAAHTPSLSRPSVAALIRKLSRRATLTASGDIDRGVFGFASEGGLHRPGDWGSDEAGDGLRSSIMRPFPRSSSPWRRERGGVNTWGGRSGGGDCGSVPAVIGGGETTLLEGGADGGGDDAGDHDGAHVQASRIEGLILKFSNGEPSVQDAPLDIRSAKSPTPRLVINRGVTK